MTARDFTERDIHLAIDGELPADDRAAFEAWLEANPDMKARSLRFGADRDLLRRAFADVLTEPAPARLVGIVSGELAPAPGRAGWWRAAAAALIFAVGGLAGYAANEFYARPNGGPIAGRTIAQEAIAAHVLYAAEKLHVVEVGADQSEHLLGWLSKRVGLQLVAPDLTTQGFEFLGGRLLPAAGGRAAQFMYQDRQGNRMSLYVTADSGAADTGFRLVEDKDASAYYWLDDGYGCAVVGNAPSDKLLDAANSAYKQLLSGQST